MSGFLDKQSRIIDAVITGYGKMMLAKGKLNFAYWVPFDDEVDYDPFISQSSSFDSDELRSEVYSQLDETLVREATTGYRLWNISGSDYTNVNRPMYTARIVAGESGILPHASSSLAQSASLVVEQRKIYEAAGGGGSNDIGYDRKNMTNERFDVSYVDMSDPTVEGFLVRIFQETQGGFVEIGYKLDMSGNICYNGDVIVGR